MKRSQFYNTESPASKTIDSRLKHAVSLSFSVGDFPGEMPGWGAQWAKLLGEQFNTAQVWIALADENKNINWIAGWPEGGVPPSAGMEGQRFFPLMHEGRTLGWLSLIPRLGHSFKPEFLEKVAEQCPMVALGLSQAMERSALIKELRQGSQGFTGGYNAMVEGLARILGLRDHETEEHTRRVSQLAMRLVEHLQIPIEEWDVIRRGFLLHDIGKLGIPDAILLKPGSLTDTERQMMQYHVVYGFNILSPIINARQTLDIVLYHHERWDGKGYPEGLKGEQIPLVARLFAVVDVFDALTTDRPYRTAWLRTQALEYIKEQSGSHFDPLMVAAFLEIAAEGVDISG